MGRTGSENRQLLSDRINELSAVIEILKEIRDNPTIGEKKLCEKHGINFRRYRRYVYDAEWFDKSSNAAESEESTAKRMQKVVPTLSWYERLWMDIMQMRYGDVDACPTQLEELLDYMMTKNGCTKTAVKEYLNAHPDISINDMDFSVRTFNCLKRADINTVDQIRQYTEEELAKVRNLGAGGVKEIKRKLDEMGFSLATESKTE